MNTTSLPKNSLSTSQIEGFKRLQSMIESDPYDYPTLPIGSDVKTKAYIAFQSLLNKGLLSGRKENHGERIDLESEEHRTYLAVAIRGFDPEDNLQDFTIRDRNFCMALDNEYRQFQFDHSLGEAIPVLKNVVYWLKFVPNLYAKSGSYIGQAVAENPGINLTGEKIPMTLDEFKRIWSEELLSNDFICQMFKDPPTPLSKEVIEYLSVKSHIEFLTTPDPARQTDVSAELISRVSNLPPDVNSDALPQHQPLLTQLQETENKILNLTLELEKTNEGFEQFSTNTEAMISELGQYVEKTLQSVEQVSREVEEIGEELDKKWKYDNDNTMKSITAVAEAIRDNLRQGRNENEKHFQFREKEREFERAKDERQQKVTIPHVGYTDYELFIQDHFQSSFLAETMFNLQKQTNDYHKTVQELQQKLKEKRERLNTIESLSTNMDSNDQNFIKIIKRAQKKKERIAKTLQIVSSTLRIASAVLAFVPGVTVVSAAVQATLTSYALQASAAASITQIGQEVIGASQDRNGRRLQRRINESSHSQHLLGNLATVDQNTINGYENELKHFQSMLLTHPECFTYEGLKKGLQDTIDKNTLDIDNFKIVEATQKNELKSAQDKVAEATETVRKRLGDLLKKKRSAEEIEKDEKYNKALHDYHEKRTEELRLKGLVDETSEKIKSCEINNDSYKKSLRENEFLQPMKKLAEEIIEKELMPFDFDRIKGGDENGELSPLGLAQKELRQNLANYNAARMLERNVAMECSQTLRGLSVELYHLTGSSTPFKLVDLGDQLYRAFDRVELLQKSYLYFETFMKTLGDEKTFIEKLGDLKAIEIIGAIIPGIQLITGGLAIIRIIHSLVSEPEQKLSPETQYLLDSMQAFFKYQQEYFHSEMNNLIEHLDRNTNQLDNELKELRSDLVETAKILSNEIHGAKEELKEMLFDNRWHEYELKIRELVLKLREKNFQLTCSITQNKIYTAKEQEKQIVEHLIYLLSKAKHFSNPILNGLMAASNGKNRIDFRLISLHPEFFAGLFTSIIPHKENVMDAIPNILLYKELMDMHKELCTFLKANPNLITDNVKKNVRALNEELRKQTHKIEKLHAKSPLFIKRAKDDKKNFENLITENLNFQKVQCLNIQSGYVWAQLKQHYANNFQQFRSQYVGGDKYYLSELINSKPMYANRLNLGLHEVYLKLETILSATSRILGCDRRDLELLSTKEFFDQCEEKINDKTQTSLKNFVSTASFTDAAPLQSYVASENILPVIEHKYVFVNQNKEINIRGYTYILGDNRTDNAFELRAGLESRMISSLARIIFGPYTPENEKSLLELSVTYDLKTLSYNTTFSPTSLIQSNDIERIKMITPATKQMKDNETLLLDCYVNWLHSLKKTEILRQDSPFGKIAQDVEPIASLEGNLLPMILPHRLLEEIEQILFMDNLDLAVTGIGLLLPFLDFKFVPSDNKYALTLHYRLDSGNSKLQDYCFFTLATFDTAAVESFKRVIFKPTQKRFQHTYEIGDAHIQEFLLQAMYAGDFEVALPGKGTTRLKNENLYIPNPQLFKGLFSIWKEQPLTITYNSSLYTQDDYSSVYGPRLQPQYGNSYLSTWRRLQSQKIQKNELKEALARYHESYHLCKGVYSLNNNLDADTSKTQLEQLGLFDPEKPEQLYFNIYKKGSTETPQAETYVKSDILPNTRPVKLGIPNTKTAVSPNSRLKGIKNIGNSCYMNASIQILIDNPDFREAIKKLDLPIYQEIKKKLAALVHSSTEKINKLLEEDSNKHLKVDINKLINGDIGNFIKEEGPEGYFSLLNVIGELRNISDESKSKFEEEALSLKRIFKDLQKIRSVMEALRDFVLKYEEPSNTPKDLEILATKLRQALFAAGKLSSGLTNQNDAAEILDFMLDAIGASTSLQFERKAVAIEFSKKDAPEPQTLIRIPINNEPKSFQELINQFAIGSLQGGKGNPWKPTDSADKVLHEIDNWYERNIIVGEPPKHIQIQLKIFNNELKKINTPVSFDSLQVDMTKMFESTSGEKALYRLKSAVIHTGTDISEGHYYTIVEDAGKWFKYDDDKPTEQVDPLVHLSRGYIFFFEKI